VLLSGLCKEENMMARCTGLSAKSSNSEPLIIQLLFGMAIDLPDECQNVLDPISGLNLIQMKPLKVIRKNENRHIKRLGQKGLS
jgi:hypothetical protein